MIIAMKEAAATAVKRDWCRRRPDAVFAWSSASRLMAVALRSIARPRLASLMSSALCARERSKARVEAHLNCNIGRRKKKRVFFFVCQIVILSPLFFFFDLRSSSLPLFFVSTFPLSRERPLLFRLLHTESSNKQTTYYYCPNTTPPPPPPELEFALGSNP